MFEALARPALYVAAAGSLAAALAHLACVFVGAPAFRALGAGEPVARMAEAGHWWPPTLAVGLTTVLGLWAVYALGAAGVLPAAPGSRLVLPAITGLLLLRACSFPWLGAVFPDNSPLFWWVSSGLCLLLGLAFLVGTIGRWPAL